MARNFLFLVLLLAGVFALNMPARAGTDWEYWSHYEAIVPLSDDFTFKVKPEIRFKDNFSKLYYVHVEMGLDCKISDWFVLSPYYRHVDEIKVEKTKEVWKQEYRPQIDATVKFKIHPFSFSDRNRIEFRVQDKENSVRFRYRNKATLGLPKFTKANIKPYVAAEPFYDFDTQRINKNRVYAGLDLDVIKHLKAGIYYILESRKGKSGWTNVNVWGTSVKYIF